MYCSVLSKWCSTDLSHIVMGIVNGSRGSDLQLLNSPVQCLLPILILKFGITFRL